jgi:hypothetical protein
VSSNGSQPLPASPAAERNKQPIADVLARVLPPAGLVLEIASGTGQHAEHFAQVLPTLTWQPSDPDEQMLPALLGHAERLLPAGAPLVLYGPFKRGGEHTAPSNAAFDEDLRRRNPEWGVRDLDDVVALARRHSLALADVVAMPANNLTVVLMRQ